MSVRDDKLSRGDYNDHYGMASPVPGWEKDISWVSDNLFIVNVRPGLEVYDRLTNEQQKRLRKKLVLVERAAKHMAAGMLKGTLKYDSDDYTVQRWLAHVVDEGADLMNYHMLLAAALEQVGQHGK